jgi:hypothetical protein
MASGGRERRIVRENLFRAATPEFMNYLDGSALVEAFEAARFQTEKAWYYTRTGLPEIFLNDGREHFGYIGCKCSSPKVRIIRLGLFDATILWCSPPQPFEETPNVFANFPIGQRRYRHRLWDN